MRALVLGGAGFIGSSLCSRLVSEGCYVCAVDNFLLGKYDNINHLIGNKCFEFVQGDISKIEVLMPVFDKVKPDTIYHLAANSDIKKSSKNPEMEIINTFSTTYAVLECMRKYKVSKLFFASSSAVYGDKKDILLKEDTPNLSPISYYGACKLGAEAIINAYSYMNDIESVVFRFPNVVGPGSTHGVIFDFVKKLRNNPNELVILGDGNQLKPYIYIDELINAIVDMMNRNLEKGKVHLYNVGVVGNTSVKKIAKIVCEEMNLRDVKIKYTGGPVGWKGDVSRYQFCYEKILNTGWYPTLTSDEAVRETVRGMLKRM